jgi:hypothetical protein
MSLGAISPLIFVVWNKVVALPAKTVTWLFPDVKLVKVETVCISDVKSEKSNDPINDQLRVKPPTPKPPPPIAFLCLVLMLTLTPLTPFILTVTKSPGRTKTSVPVYVKLLTNVGFVIDDGPPNGM